MKGRQGQGVTSNDHQPEKSWSAYHGDQLPSPAAPGCARTARPPGSRRPWLCQRASGHTLGTRAYNAAIVNAELQGVALENSRHFADFLIQLLHLSENLIVFHRDGDHCPTGNGGNQDGQTDARSAFSGSVSVHAVYQALRQTDRRQAGLRRGQQVACSRTQHRLHPT